MGSRKPLLCGVELGGSKCVCLAGSGPDDIRGRVTLATGSDAGATLERIAGTLEDFARAQGGLDGIGLASFGPLQLRRESRDYGRILQTPKPGWGGVDLVGFFARRFGAPLGFTTDVIGAALAEGRWGAARGLSDYAYVTVGTGVGVGLVAAGRPLLGVRHPEAGHLRIARAAGDSWPGICRFHRDCVEGLASGPAIQARCGAAPEELPGDSPVWDSVAHALGQLAHNLVLTAAPARILFGGGVPDARPQLLALIRARLAESLNGYVEVSEIPERLEDFIAPPGLGALAGPLGAIAVAADASMKSA